MSNFHGFCFTDLLKVWIFIVGFIVKTRFFFLEQWVWSQRNLGKMKKKLQNLRAIERQNFYTSSIFFFLEFFSSQMGPFLVPFLWFLYWISWSFCHFVFKLFLSKVQIFFGFDLRFWVIIISNRFQKFRIFPQKYSDSSFLTCFWLNCLTFLQDRSVSRVLDLLKLYLV